MNDLSLISPLSTYILQGVPKNYHSGILENKPMLFADQFGPHGAPSPWRTTYDPIGPTGPKITYGFVLKKFHKGIFWTPM